MTRREFLMVVALLTTALISAQANPPAVLKDPSADKRVPTFAADNKNDAEASRSEPLSVEPSPLISKDESLASAYFSTLSILSTSNGCSLFFGGPAASVEVFKQLIGKVRKDYFATPIGMQMSGETVSVTNAATRTEYRLFDKVSINSNGPFYRRQLSGSALPLHFIGTFRPNTKEVRVLMFLHELGHTIKGEDGNWLLPDDGKDESLSRLNSQKIEDVCGRQIRALRKHEGKDEARIMLAGKTDRAASGRDTAAPPGDKNTERANTGGELNKN